MTTTIVRLLDIANAKPGSWSAWLCPTSRAARVRAEYVATALSAALIEHELSLAEMTIRLPNGSTILFVSAERPSMERVRGLNLAAAVTMDMPVEVPRLVKDRLVWHRGVLIR